MPTPWDILLCCLGRDNGRQWTVKQPLTETERAWPSRAPVFLDFGENTNKSNNNQTKQPKPASETASKQLLAFHPPTSPCLFGLDWLLFQNPLYYGNWEYIIFSPKEKPNHCFQFLQPFSVS